jgi:hypothetical protein
MLFQFAKYVCTSMADVAHGAVELPQNQLLGGV